MQRGSQVLRCIQVQWSFLPREGEPSAKDDRSTGGVLAGRDVVPPDLKRVGRARCW